MLNRCRLFSQATIAASILTTCVLNMGAAPARSGVLPEVWGTVGAADDLISYGAGVRIAGTGIEVGTGEDGATGADFLTFIGLPIVSPYLGLGYYSGDESIAYSGGIHLGTGKILLGGGYHSVRGFNGRLGFRF